MTLRLPHLIAFLALGHGDLAAQAECPGCRTVQVTHVASLGDTTGGPNFIGQLAAVARTASGHFVVADIQKAPMMVFDSTGEFVQTLGRDGEGPGEFSLGTLVLPHEDGLEVLDLWQGRRTRYTSDFASPDVDRFLAPLDRDATRIGTHYVRGRPYAGAADPDAPVHVISQDGTHLRSFGSSTPSRDTRRSHSHSRRFSPTSDSTFWSGDLLQYRLRHWTLNGRLLQECTREPEWFPPQDRFGIVDGQPRPGLVAISYDPDADVLWTATAVPGPDWEEDASYRPQVVPGLGPSPEAESVYRTIVEAIDPNTCAVIGRAEIDTFMDNDAGPGLFFGEDRTAYGEPVVRVWRVRLID